MKRKVAILVLAGLLALTVSGFAAEGPTGFAIGAELTTINFFGAGAMMTLHFPAVPLYFGIGLDFSDEPALTMTVDYWMLHRQISGAFDWYLGVGAFGAVSFDSPSGFGFGIRLPVGIQLWPLDNQILELFLEVAPAWVPFRSSGFDAGNFLAQVALGFRFWP